MTDYRVFEKVENKFFSLIYSNNGFMVGYDPEVDSVVIAFRGTHEPKSIARQNEKLRK